MNKTLKTLKSINEIVFLLGVGVVLGLLIIGAPIKSIAIIVVSIIPAAGVAYSKWF